MVATVDGEEKECGSLRLRLGDITAPVEIPAGQSSLAIRLPKTEQTREPWCRIQAPESGDFIVVLWRDLRNNSWNEPSSYVFRASLQPERASLLNVALRPVAVVYESERIALPPLRPVVRPLKSGKPLAFQVGLPMGNTLRRLVSRSLEHPPGCHSLVVFYQADGEKPRSPLGIEVVRLWVGKEEVKSTMPEAE
jgi:hypothetical protein